MVSSAVSALVLAMWSISTSAQTVTAQAEFRTLEISSSMLQKIAPPAGRATSALNEKCHCDASKVLNASFDELLAKCKAAGKVPKVYDITVYLGDQAFRVDMPSPTGKISQIFHIRDGKIYGLMWAQKKYTEMSIAQMKKMREGVQAQMQQLAKSPEMQKMLEQLPPDMREKMMKQMQGAMGASPGAAGKPAGPQIKKTGRHKTLHGFPCDEYLVASETSTQYVWATKVKPALLNSFKNFGEQLSQLSGGAGKESEFELWKQLPDAMPVLIKDFNHRKDENVALEVTELKSFAEKTLPASTFSVPKGFTKVSLMEMSPGQLPR